MVTKEKFMKIIKIIEAVCAVRNCTRGKIIFAQHEPAKETQQVQRGKKEHRTTALKSSLASSNPNPLLYGSKTLIIIG